MGFFFELFGGFWYLSWLLFLIYVASYYGYFYDEKGKFWWVLWKKDFRLKVFMFFIKYSILLFILYAISKTSSGFEMGFLALMIFFIDFWKEIAEILSKKSILAVLLVALAMSTIIAWWIYSIIVFEVRDISQTIDVNWNSIYTRTRGFEEWTGFRHRIKEISCEGIEADNGWYIFHSNCPISPRIASQTWEQVYYKKTMNFVDPEVKKLEDNIESVKKILERMEASLTVFKNKQNDNLLQSTP